MSAELLEIHKERLRKYYDAETAVLQGQAYTMGSVSLTRANLADIRRAISDIETKIRDLSTNGGKRKAKRVIPRDW